MSRNVDSACPFLPCANTKRGKLSQHFVTHVVPPLKKAQARYDVENDLMSLTGEHHQSTYCFIQDKKVNLQWNDKSCHG